MAAARREVDRGLKQHAIHNRATGRIARTLSVDDEMAGSSTAAWKSCFRKVVAQIVEDRGIQCLCPEAGAWKSWLPDEAEGDVLLIDIGCDECGHTESIEVTRGEFTRIGRGLKKPGLAGDQVGPDPAD